MILSDREIRAAMSRGFVQITPEPDLQAWASTAVDLTLAPTFRRWTLQSSGGLAVEFRPGDPAFDFLAIYEQYTESVKIAPDGYLLEPNSFILGWTIEKISLPHSSRLAAREEVSKPLQHSVQASEVHEALE